MLSFFNFSIDRKQLLYAAGLLCVIGVVVLWVSSAYVMKLLFNGDFDKPFFITYLNTGAFSLNLIPIAIRKLRNKKSRSSSSADIVVDEEDEQTSKDLPFRDTAVLALQFCFIWFASNFAYNFAISQTTVAKSTILSSTSGFFTLIFGIIARTERLSTAKVIAFCNTVIGTILVVAQKKEDSASYDRTDLTGMGLALVSAVLYGLYITLFKMRVKDGTGVSLSLFFGLVGVFNIILLWPVILVLHYSGVEEFSLPNSAQDWAFVMGNALFGTVLSDYLWAQATCWTSALVVTLGISLTNPITLVIDAINDGGVHHVPVLGALLILVGFFGINEDAIKGRKESDMTINKNEEDLEGRGVPPLYNKE